MYSLIITKGKIKQIHHLGLEKYSRHKNSSNGVDMIIEIDPKKKLEFEVNSGVTLKTSKDFQGEMSLNKES